MSATHTPLEAVKGVALGWRTELAAELWSRPESVDFLEVTAEGCFALPQLRREALALSARWPVVLHGIKTSLGSAEGLEKDRVERLAQLVRELQPTVLTEHVAFTRGGATEIGHLTALPRTHAAAAIVARNVETLRRAVGPVPLYLENVAWTFRWPENQLSEGAFYNEVCRRTGCPLLLDLGNLYANARNAGLDPVEQLLEFPLDRIAMLHVAGGAWEGSFYFDTHAHPIPREVFSLVKTLFDRIGSVPIVLERDSLFPPFQELRTELEQLRALTQSAPRAFLPPEQPPSIEEVPKEQQDLLFAGQCKLAELLTTQEFPSEIPHGWDRGELDRSRAVLQRKRVDDALPLLSRCALRGEQVRDLLLHAVATMPRAQRHAGIADALRLAERLAQDPQFARDARLDALPLRARWVGPALDGTIRPRQGPFIGRVSVGSGRSVWAFKGLGSTATVRLFGRTDP